MVKLVDMPDLGSGAARRVGSSPIIRTKKLLYMGSFFYFISLCNFKILNACRTFLLILNAGSFFGRRKLFCEEVINVYSSRHQDPAS